MCFLQFLGSAEKGEKKKKKQKKKSEDDDGYLSDDITKDVDKSYKNCASRLSYKVSITCLILHIYLPNMLSSIHHQSRCMNMIFYCLFVTF